MVSMEHGGDRLDLVSQVMADAEEGGGLASDAPHLVGGLLESRRRRDLNPRPLTGLGHARRCAFPPTLARSYRESRWIACACTGGFRMPHRVHTAPTSCGRTHHFALRLAGRYRRCPLSFAKTPSGGQVVDRSALIRTISERDDHPRAPSGATPPVPLRQPAPARPGEPRPTRAARRVQTHGASAQIAHDGSPRVGWGWPEPGPAGGRLWSSCRPTPSCDGSTDASASAGPSSPVGLPEPVLASMPRSPPSSGKWPRRIPCGVPRAYTESS